MILYTERERDRQTDSHYNRGQDNIVSGENKTDFFKKKFGFAFFCGFEYLEKRCEQLLLGLLAKRLTK